MSALRVLPRWHSQRGINPAKIPRRIVRAQHSKPQPSSPSNATSDPIQVLHTTANTANGPKPRTSIVGLLFRGIFYTALFGAVGATVGAGYTTWKYMRTGQLIGRPEVRDKTKKRLNEAIDLSTLVQSLRADGWIEENPRDIDLNIEDAAKEAVNVKTGNHLVNDRLVENGYLATRYFRNPKDLMTVVVFVADTACESWPETLHGGIATMVIQEALNTHVKNFSEYGPLRNRETTMNYRIPLSPRKVYSVFIQTEGTEFSSQPTGKADESLMGVSVNLLVNEMDRAPRYVDKYDEATKTTKSVCEIHDKVPGISAYVRGASMLFLASKQYRENIEKNKKALPDFQQKLDAWLRAHEHQKARPTK